MPLSQQDAEGIGLNISRALFPGYHERRADRAAAADLKRKQALEEMVATIAQRNAMEQLREREAGDTARADRANAAAMERAILGENRADYRAHAQRGAMLDGDRISAEQRESSNRAMREQMAAEAVAELHRRKANDAMNWWDNSAKIQIDRKKAEADILDQEARRPFEELKSRAAAINAINIAKEAGLDVEDELMQKAGLKIGQPGSALSKPTRREFQSRVVKPTVTVDYGAQNVTNSATNVPMPPDANGQRKPSGAGGENAATNFPGGIDVRNFIEALSDKSLKPR